MILPKPDRLTSVVDVGAAAIDTPPSYLPLLDRGLCSVVGFDPQTQFWPRTRPGVTILPDVIGDGLVHTLYVSSAPGMTGLLPPAYGMLNALSPIAAGGPEWGKVVSEKRVQTYCLDGVAAISCIDMLRMDAQGAELMVIDGAEQKLADAVCVQTEVSFVELYRDQPTFGDIHEALAIFGFVFHTFVEFQARTIAPSNARGRQIIQADAVYVRDFRHMDLMTDNQLKHLALIAHHCYQSDDLAQRCVEELKKRGNDECATSSLQRS